MARLSLVRTASRPYHVVNQVNNRDWFQISMDKTWEIFSHALFETCVLYSIQIHAFVLMSNHYHLILSTPYQDLGVVMRYFSAQVTKDFNFAAGREGHLFKGRYKWSLIGDPLYFFHAVKYIYRNPVRAGICSHVEKYPHSSLQGLLGLGLAPVRFPVSPSPFQTVLDGTPTDWMMDFNRPSKKEHEESIRSALRRSIFELPKVKDGVRRIPSTLESEPS